VLSYLRRAPGVETHLCLLTRGEGLDNDTGPERGAKLAVLRTRETEAACAILGAKAWYLNLPDFGYSKSADEALNVWGHDKALSQLVRIIRIVKPHVVFTNLDAEAQYDGLSAAVARLRREAFDAAADETKFAEQMKEDGTKAWAVQKLYVGCNSEKATLHFDAWKRDPMSGLDTREIAVLALRKHDRQGELYFDFGQQHVLRDVLLAKSRLPKADNDKSLLGGLPSPSEKLAAAIDAASKLLNPDAMKDGSLAQAIAKAIEADGGRQTRGPAREHMERALAEALGVRLDVRVGNALTTCNQPVEVTADLTHAGPLTLTTGLRSIATESTAWRAADPAGGVRQARADIVWCGLGGGLEALLPPQKTARLDAVLTAGDGAFPTWPREEFVFGRLESRSPATVRFELVLGETAFTVSGAIPLDLASQRTVAIAPDPVLVFDDPDHGDDVLVLARFRMDVTNYKRLDTPLKLYGGILPQDGTPVDKAATFVFVRQGETQSAEFRFMAPVAQLNKGDIEVPTAAWTDEVNFGGPKARLRRVPLRLSAPLAVGLVKGPGDELLNALQALADAGLGMTLTVLSADDLRASDLNKLHTIVVDNNAALRRPEVLDAKSRLMQFMNDGGNVVCMDRNACGIAPFALKLGAERVTDETAEARILDARHPLLLTPCKIWARDFQGWIEERGAFFPTEWAPEYKPLLSCNDPGEKPLDGGLLVADAGAGSFIYTSLAWPKQLRAGVPGAYRMLANMLSYPRVKRGARP
jgi:LmbE family N-acetylglucosaminyl deacetylase